MARPEHPKDPKVVDLKARRRAAELQKQALKSARSNAGPNGDLNGGGLNGAGKPKPSGRRLALAAHPLTAWAVLLVAALLWALLRWLQA